MILYIQYYLYIVNKITTTLLEDHYMIPGVNWSLIKKGETVEVLGRLSNGWYRCRANKDASYELEELPPSPKPHDDEESNVSGKYGNALK